MNRNVSFKELIFLLPMLCVLIYFKEGVKAFLLAIVLFGVPVVSGFHIIRWLWFDKK